MSTENNNPRRTLYRLIRPWFIIPPLIVFWFMVNNDISPLMPSSESSALVGALEEELQTSVMNHLLENAEGYTSRKYSQTNPVTRQEFDAAVLACSAPETGGEP